MNSPLTTQHPQLSSIHAGYKQTEVGVIPEEWEVKTVGDFVITLEAGVSVNSQDKEVSPEEMAILKTSCVAHGAFIPDECKCIVTNDLHRAKITPLKDTIIFSRMNTPALVGECGYIEHDYPKLFLPDRLWMSRPNTRTSHNVRWLAFLLGFPTFNRAIKESATGTSGSMKNISKNSLLAVRIPAPSLPEQRAIATALSDVDALLASLDQLIAKSATSNKPPCSNCFSQMIAGNQPVWLKLPTQINDGVLQVDRLAQT